jgi:iron complex outermembrane recepter protein
MKPYHCLTTLLIPCAALAQNAEPSTANAAGGSEQEEEIVVTGFRGSLRESLELKKEAIVVRDSIVAEDIGKFPEANVAESLQRIPGVYLDRDESSAEGQRISIRGLASEFSVTTLNGAPIHTTSAWNIGGASRAFNYDVFASELFGRVDFYKTPLAELPEGGIGGVVDLQTPRPFDNPDQTIRYALTGSYNTSSEETDPNAFAFYSNTWGNWGVLVAAAHSTSVNTRSGFEATGGYNSSFRGSQSPVRGTFAIALDYDDPRTNLGAYTREQVDNALLPRIYRFYGSENERTRNGAVASLQYKTDVLDISLDALYSKLENSRTELTFGILVRNSITTNRAQPPGRPGHTGIVPIDVQIDPESNLLTGTFGNTTYSNGAAYGEDETEFKYLALSAKWDISDTLSISGQVGGSDSPAFIYSNTISGQLFGIDSTIDYGSDHVYPSLSSPVSYTDPNNYDGFGTSLGWSKETNEERQGRLIADWDYNLPFGIEAKLRGGVSYVSTTKDINKRNGTALAMAHLNAVGPGHLRGGMTTTLPIDNMDMGSGWPQTWAVFSREYVFGEFHPLAFSPESTFTPAQSFAAEEQVSSVFVQSDFSRDVFNRQLRVNAGVRVSDTETLIDNFQQQGTSLTYGPNHVEGSYSDVLPSISAAYDLTDTLTWRLSWGETITRASLSIIAAQTVIPNPFDNTATAGNPNLRPQLSSNYDTSLDWYFATDSVLSVGFFKKHMTDTTIANTQIVTFGSLGLPDTALGAIFHDANGRVDPNLPMTLRTYVNGDSIDLDGYELAYQQTFSFLPAPWDGFGALASYTRIDSTGLDWVTTSGEVLNVNEVPEYSYSLTGYYEKGPFGIRLSYNYKDRFIHADGLRNTGDDLRRWRAGRGYLDGNISFQVSDYLELRLDALNITDTLAYDYFEDVTGQYGSGEKARMDYAKYDGRTIKVGVRGRF